MSRATFDVEVGAGNGKIAVYIAEQVEDARICRCAGLLVLETAISALMLSACMMLLATLPGS